MNASDYKTSYPYGAISPPYSPGSPHKGDDRPTPYGTDLDIGGVTAGKTGNSGKVSPKPTPNNPKAGSHLHIQEWSGKVSDTRKPQNSFKGGLVTDTSTSPEWGKHITVKIGDWNTTYAHLSEINVKVGDIIGGDMQKEIDELRYKLSESEKALRAREKLTGELEYKLSESEKALRAREKLTGELEYKLSESEKALRNREKQSKELQDRIKQLESGINKPLVIEYLNRNLK